MNATHDDPRAMGQAQPAPQPPPQAEYVPQQAAYPPAPRDPRTRSPLLAGILSVFPGLGQVYVGYYPRGFFNLFVCALVFTFMVNTDPGSEPVLPFLVLFLIFFWLYNIIDATRRAALLNQTLAGNQQIELPKDFKMPGIGGSIPLGLILIVGGSILLAHTRYDVSLAWIEDWWPAAPILFGLWLIARAVQERLVPTDD